MRVSVNAIRHINEHESSAGSPAQKGVKDLATKIGAQLGAIEEVIAFGDRFKDVLVVKIVSAQPHPNADKLQVCMIDDGGKAKGVNRDETGLVQVVCGAPNARTGIFTTWLRPGVAVPETIDKEPFVLDAREIRGQVSNGMLASAKELGLSDDHSGILEIDPERDSEGSKPIKPGMPFGDVCHLTGDVVLDIENKMFTHRPDCFGWLGVAREIEGIYGRKYKSPKWYTVSPKFSGIEAAPLKLEVINELPEMVPRFTAITMRGVQVGPSPLWLQVDLARAGIRSINNIVDFTNWYMVLTGQPLHAYDYDKVMAKDPGAKHATLVVRYPKKGEKLPLLNGKTVEPKPESILIATKNQPIGIGGIMGGADTEVDNTTSNIILEAATFDMYSIRRSSMSLGLFTDAATRFTKGQSPLQNLAALGKITDSIRKYAHGKVAGPVIDVNNLSKAVRERRSLHTPVRITADFINARLGLNLKKIEIATLLTNVEFDVNTTGRDISVTAPFWRTDIEIPEDVVEEVGRLHGFDKLPLELPMRSLTPAPKDPVLQLKNDLREALSSAGANELLTYSFVHGNLLDSVGQDKTHAYQIGNALSPDLQYYRLSLMPSLLDKVHSNIKAGHDKFALFELNRIHFKGQLDDEGLPKEDEHLSLVFAAKNVAEGAPFYQVKRYLKHIMPNVDSLLVPLNEFEFGKDDWGKQMCAPFEPKRSAAVVHDGLVWGVVGEYRASVAKALKLPVYTAGFELGLDILQSNQSQYVQLPRFPKIEQDICLRVGADITYGQIYSLINDEIHKSKLENSILSLYPVDIYQSQKDKSHKQITLRVSVASFNRTLTDSEVSELLNKVAAKAKEKLKAERV